MQPTHKHRKPKGGGESLQLAFDRDDFDVLDIALRQSPELRLCAGILKAARAAKLKYPIMSSGDLSKLLPAKQVFVENHILRPALIARYMPDEYFPIGNEPELVSRCYIGLLRCKEDMAWAARAPEHAQALLAELAEIVAARGEH